MTTAVTDQIHRGVRCLDLLDAGGAEAAFHEATARSAGDPDVKKSAAEAYRNAGWRALNIPGGFELAWRIFQNARALYESLGKGCEFEVAKICRGLSITAGKLGDRESSLYYGEEAEAQLERSQIPQSQREFLMAKLRNDRAISLRKLGRSAEAGRLIRENLEWLASRPGLTDRLLAANIHQNHGYQLMGAGEGQAAVLAFQAARERLVAGDKKIRVPGCDLRLAEAWLASGAFDQAEVSLKQAQAGFRRQREPSLWAADLEGRLRLRRGDVAGARKCFACALRQADRQRGSLAAEDFRMSFQGTVQDVYRRAFHLEPDRPAMAFALAERARARAFLDIVDSCERLEFPGLRPSERARLEKHRVAIQAGGANGDDVNSAKNAYLMLVRRFEQAVRDRRGLPQVKSLSAAAIRRRLAADEAVVEYFDDGSAMHVFVLRRRELVRRVLKTPSAAIREEMAALPAAVHAARREGRQGGPQTVFAWTMRDLYRLLWAPIAQDVAGATRIVLVPGPALYGLPFAALRSGKTALVERHEFRLAPSASVATILRSGRRFRRTGTRPRCLFVKDPTGTLTQAGEEERVLRAVFGRRLTVLAGTAATPAEFSRLAPKHDVLHIATHATYSAERPEFSAFDLSAGGNSGDVARCHAVDVAGLDLRRCRVVVLSACETARSHGMGADEMLGLPRAFLRAGASSVVATLWPIAEHAELPRMMAALYAGGAAEDAPAALRSAQCDAVKRGGAADMWAGWVGMG